jgi:hypothetical protein
LENKEATNDQIQPAYDALSEEIQKVGAQMYQQAAPNQPQAEEDGVKVKENVNEEKPEEEVVEGEVVNEKNE